MFVVVGIARLPRALAGEQAGPLLIELVVNPKDGIVSAVASSIVLPGYRTLLQRLLIGRRLEEAGSIAAELCACCRGPLLKPTIAALANAVSNARSKDEEKPVIVATTG